MGLQLKFVNDRAQEFSEGYADVLCWSICGDADGNVRLDGQVAFWRSADSFAAGEPHEGTMRVTVNPYDFDGTDCIKALLDAFVNPPEGQPTMPADIKTDVTKATQISTPVKKILDGGGDIKEAK
jgi:hypothetical protein